MRNKDDCALHKALALADTRIHILYIHWCVTHFAPCVQQQGILSKQI